MCMALSVGLLEFAIMIYVVLLQNNCVGPCIDSHISSRMEDIYFEALSPDTAAINSASVELVATVTFRLLL